MKPDKQIEQRLEQLADCIGPRDSFVDDVMTRIENSPVQPGIKQMQNHGLRRIFMKNPFKLTAAAILLIAAVLSLTLFDKTIAPAYALEQTVQACHSLRFIHLKCNPPGNGVEEIWAQFDEKGQLQLLRMNFPNTEDGPKDVVWQEGKAQVWFKAKNSAVVVREPAMLIRLKMSYADFDPKLIVESLYQSQSSGKGQIEIDDPHTKGQPIVITSTIDGFRDVYSVDPETKLLQQIEKYQMENGEYKPLGTIMYLDYNQPANAGIFTLNLPPDIMQIDQTTQQIGLAQGKMTNDEVAIEVVRQFWQAIIDGDYAQAGQMYEGVPAAMLQKVFADNLKGKVVEIISVGPVQPHPNPKTGGVIVPCTLKIVENGQITEQTFDKIGVRQVHNQPERWTIFGGL